MSIDLSAPSDDVPTLLRQWLAVHAGAKLSAGNFFLANKSDMEREIVELTANIATMGTTQYKPGDVTPSVMRLARKLNAGDRWHLHPDFLAALQSGVPVFALKLGLEAKTVVASTGPGSV